MTLATALTLTVAAHAEPRPNNLTAKIDQARANTHRCQRQLGLDPSPVSTKPISSAAYAAWVLALWRARAESYCRLARELGTPIGAIRAVFGRYADQALAVSRCESGHSRTPRARNGQYLGMFQMGEYARSRYGHGDTPLEQAKAARRYFEASGRDWSPWQCSPHGGLQW